MHTHHVPRQTSPLLFPHLKPLDLQASNRNQINNETMFKTELNDRLIGQRRMNGAAKHF